MPQQQLQCFPSILQASPRFVFGQKALMNSSFAGIVHLVGDARKLHVNACKLQIIIDFVQKIPQGSGVSIPGANQPRQARRELLLDRLLQHRTAHHGAGRKQAKKIAARRFIQIAARLF